MARLRRALIRKISALFLYSSEKCIDQGAKTSVFSSQSAAQKAAPDMAVFRIEKTKNHTVMSNYHLRDRSLLLKAKGLFSLMLSLPESWDYTMKGLARICKDGIDRISGGLKENDLPLLRSEHGVLASFGGSFSKSIDLIRDFSLNTSPDALCFFGYSYIIYRVEYYPCGGAG